MGDRLVATLDANLLVDIILTDESELSDELLTVLEHQQLVAPVFVLIEVEFVLSRVYKFSRRRVTETLETLLRQPWLKTNQAIIRSALAMYEVHPKLSLVDCCLMYFARYNQEMPVYTRDRKMAVQSGGMAQLVP